MVGCDPRYHVFIMLDSIGQFFFVIFLEGTLTIFSGIVFKLDDFSQV